MDQRVFFIQKLFIWSLIFEPLKFFLLSTENSVGFSLTAAKVLQLFFIISLFFYIVSNRSFILNKKIFFQLKYLFIFTLIIIITIIYGIFFGSYENNENDINVFLRPFINLLAFFYYSIYYLVLPSIIINSKKALQYFFYISKNVFLFVIITGLLDVFFNLFGIDIIPRHLVDSYWVGVGLRFHGILGEPRDAFVYLVYGIALLALISFINKEKKISYTFLSIIFFSLALTQSVSGIVGLTIGSLLIIYYTNLLKFKNVLYVVAIILLLIFAMYVSIKYSTRLDMYFLELQKMFYNLENKIITDLILVQSTDIVPVWLFYNHIINFEIYNILFGNGFSSSSFSTNIFMEKEQFINNPRSQLARVLYETGAIGLYVYITFLVKPIKQLILEYKDRKDFFLLCSSLLLFGSTLGHRSLLAFVFVGIIISILVNNLVENDK